MNPEDRSKLLDRILDYEAGQLSEAETVKLFQELIDTGLCWHLQGSYGRMAQALLEQGVCHTAGKREPETEPEAEPEEDPYMQSVCRLASGAESFAAREKKRAAELGTLEGQLAEMRKAIERLNPEQRRALCGMLQNMMKDMEGGESK